MFFYCVKIKTANFFGFLNPKIYKRKKQNYEMLKTRDFTYDFVNYRVAPKKLSTFTAPRRIVVGTKTRRFIIRVLIS